MAPGITWKGPGERSTENVARRTKEPKEVFCDPSTKRDLGKQVGEARGVGRSQV